MKNILIAIVAATSFAAFANDTVEKTEVKTEVHTGAKKSSVKVEAKSVKDPPGLMNSTTKTAKAKTDTEANADGTTTTTAESQKKVDGPGMKNDSKITTKTKVTRDANGNVVEAEKTVDGK